MARHLVIRVPGFIMFIEYEVYSEHNKYYCLKIVLE
jgi:hypothetical protein